MVIFPRFSLVLASFKLLSTTACMLRSAILRVFPWQVHENDHITQKKKKNKLQDRWAQHEYLIVGGDTNNVPDIAFDKRRLKPRVTPEIIEDMDPYFKFLHTNDLVDTYAEQYDPSLGPVVMTHKSSKGTSESRLDKWFHSTPLADFAWIDPSTYLVPTLVQMPLPHLSKQTTTLLN